MTRPCDRRRAPRNADQKPSDLAGKSLARGARLLTPRASNERRASIAFPRRIRALSASGSTRPIGRSYQRMPFVVCVRRHGKEIDPSTVRAAPAPRCGDGAEAAVGEISPHAPRCGSTRRVSAPHRLKVHGRLSTHARSNTHRVPSRRGSDAISNFRGLRLRQIAPDLDARRPMPGGCDRPAARRRRAFLPISSTMSCGLPSAGNRLARLGAPPAADPPLPRHRPRSAFALAGSAEAHYHIPLLGYALSYATYRGTLTAAAGPGCAWLAVFADASGPVTDDHGRAPPARPRCAFE